jgi:hypothetical protein
MNEASVRADVLCVAVAMLGNPEAFKQATRVIEHECHIKIDPTQKIAEWSIAIVTELLKQQRKM